jgi:insertion element IS1 protein InsB
VLQPESRVIDEGQRSRVERLLREKISLHGICHAVGVSIGWCIDFMVDLFEAAPDHLHVCRPHRPGDLIIRGFEAEADERHSFVKNKANEPWIGLAMDRITRQIIAFHVGDRSRKRAQQLWANRPAVYRKQATFSIDR